MSDRRRHFDDQHYVHFVTFSVHKRRRLLDLDQPKRIVLGVLAHQLRAMQGKCLGFVLMSNHVHALIWLPQPETAAPLAQRYDQSFCNCSRSSLLSGIVPGS